MPNSLTIESADRSVRWYLTPGQTSRYEIWVTNTSGDERFECTMALDEPADGGVFEPASFILRPRERKTVALTFHENTDVPREQRAVISVRDIEGIVMASLERGLISAGGTDCTVTLSWKEPILDGDQVRGFVMSCALKSLSASPGTFALQPTPHPALEFVDVSPVKLEPGQSATIAVPVLWNRSVKDADGNDHPRLIEIGVAVSQGRRTGRLLWETIEGKLAALAAAAAPQPAQAFTQLADAPVSDEQALQLFETSGGRISSTAPGDVAGEIAASSAPRPQPPPGDPTTDEDALMSLLVGKPVSPPSGWRGPGRDAPDAPSGPATIFARTPSSVTTPPPPRPAEPVERARPPQPPQAPPPLAPVEQARPLQPPARPVESSGVPQAARIIGPATMRPPRQPGEGDPPQMEAPTAASNGSAPPSGAMAPSQSDFEASVVGPPPSLARAIESGKEHSAAMRRTSEGPEVRSRMRDGQLPTLVISGTALIALAFAVFFYIRPNQSQVAPQPVQATQTAAIAQQSTAAAQGTAQAQASPQNTVPPPVVLETVVPGQPKNATSGNHAIASTGAQTAVKPVPTIAASAAARVATQATLRASSTTPAPRAATPHPAQIAQAPKPTAAPHPHPRSRRPVGASPNRIVDIQGIGAHYGPAGHAVRVAWGASGQASAHVELFDDRGGTLSQTDVVGTRQSAVLYVPQSYHGAVTVQVVSVGALGERVTQSTSLPAFSH